MSRSAVQDALAKARRSGYIAAALGAVVGAIGGGLVGGGAAFFALKCEGGLECLGPAFFAMAIGVLSALAASVGGCYWALRLRGHDRAGRTAAVMAALLPVAGFVSVVLAGAVTIFGPVIGIAGAALAARRLAIGKQVIAFAASTNDERGTV